MYKNKQYHIPITACLLIDIKYFVRPLGQYYLFNLTVRQITCMISCSLRPQQNKILFTVNTILVSSAVKGIYDNYIVLYYCNE